MEKEREELGWIKDFKVENRDKKFCYEFQISIRRMYVCMYTF